MTNMQLIQVRVLEASRYELAFLIDAEEYVSECDVIASRGAYEVVPESDSLLWRLPVDFRPFAAVVIALHRTHHGPPPDDNHI
jgi:hypothetical protein